MWWDGTMSGSRSTVLLGEHTTGYMQTAVHLANTPAYNRSNWRSAMILSNDCYVVRVPQMAVYQTPVSWTRPFGSHAREAPRGYRAL